MNMTPLATPTSPSFPAYIMNMNAGHAGPMGGGAMPMANGSFAMGMGPPSALSPGAFWGRAGEGSVYAAPVGAPPHPHSPYYGGGSPGFFGLHALVAPGPVEEPKGYFDFPPAPNAHPSRLSRILAERER